MRPLLRLALPLIAINLGNMLLGVVDTAIAGKVDGLTQAAVGLGNALAHFGHMFGLGLALGVDPLISHALGEGNPRLARRAMWQGIHAVLLVSLPLAVIVALLGAPLEALGIDPALAARTRDYLLPRVFGFLPFHLFIAMRAYLQSSHITWPMIISTIAANVMNAALGWTLAMGAPSIGLAPMGAAGLAWAATASFVLQAAVLAVCVGTIHPGPGLEPLRALDRGILGKVFKLGIPVALQVLAEGGIFALVGLLASRMSPAAGAAHHVALVLAAFAFMIPLGISIATVVHVGRAIGGGDTPAARRVGFLGIRLGGFVMVASGAAMAFFPRGIAALLADDPEIISIATGLIRIAAAFQIFDGVQTVAGGALRGVGQTRWPFIVNFVGLWILGLPLGLVLAYPLGLGAAGLWWGLTLGLAIVAVAMTWRFHRATLKHVASVWHA